MLLDCFRNNVDDIFFLELSQFVEIIHEVQSSKNN